MLRIVLEEGSGEAGVSLPLMSQARLKGCFLCVGPNDNPLVRQERQLWTYGAISFSAAVIDQPIRLRFESETGGVSDFRCYEGLRIAAGRLIAGGKTAEVLASYDEVRQVWKNSEGAPQMSRVLILPAVPAN
jgi:hypothetical protein